MTPRGRAAALAVAAAGGLTLAGCGFGERIVHGQIAVADERGAKMPLAHVRVLLVSERAMKEHLARGDGEHRDEVLNAQRLGLERSPVAAGVAAQADSLDLAREAPLRAELSDVLERLSGAEYRERTTRAAADRAAAAFAVAYERRRHAASAAEVARGEVDAPAERRAMERSTTAADEAESIAALARERVATLREQLPEATRRPEFNPPSAPALTSAWYFEHLPAAVATAESDSSGSFTLRAPVFGRYVLVARAERSVPGAQSCYWLMRLAGREVMLDDSTRTTSGSPLSLLHLAE